MWHSGPCSLCCTNVSICKKVGKEKVAAKTQGKVSCCHCCVHETLSSGGVLGMYGSCGFSCWELVPNVAKPSGLVAGDRDWALPIQKLQPRNGWIPGVGKAGGKAAWWSWAPFLDRKRYLCIAQVICECSISLCSRRSWGVQLQEQTDGWMLQPQSITFFQDLGWLQHADIPSDQGFLSGGCANEKVHFNKRIPK